MTPLLLTDTTYKERKNFLFNAFRGKNSLYILIDQPGYVGKVKCLYNLKHQPAPCTL